MAEYTVELRKIVDSGYNIFNFPYAFYDEEKRRDFERKFIQHFYFREIGAATVDRFVWYLRDKMETVFPYYNKLFEAAAIKYDVLDNYKLTEEITISRDNTGKTAGISSTVGQLIGKVGDETNIERSVSTNGSATGSANDTETETTASTNNRTVEVEGNDAKDQTVDMTKKFLDTPQGLFSVSDSNYITNLTNDKGTTVETGIHSEDTTENGSGNVTRELTHENKNQQATFGEETTAESIGKYTDEEQKTTQDNNTRTYHDSKQTETQKLVRRGNIGVDTDSDAIEKHIRLQKTLTQIELMFFNECEDLFMLVY